MNPQKTGLPSIHSLLNSSFHDDWKEKKVQRHYLPRVKLPSIAHPCKNVDPILHIHFQAANKKTATTTSPLYFSPAAVVAATTSPSPGSLSKPHAATTVRKRRYDRYRCVQCAKVFSRPSSLRVHILSHTGEKPHMCPRYGCGRRFSVYSNMRRHLKIHE